MTVRSAAERAGRWLVAGPLAVQLLAGLAELTVSLAGLAGW